MIKPPIVKTEPSWFWAYGLVTLALILEILLFTWITYTYS